MAEFFTIYSNIYDDIRQKIRNGTYKSGEKLPTVPELCEIYSTSDVTIRKSLEMLKDDGYIYSKKRIGIFVASDKQIKSLMYLNEYANVNFGIDKIDVLSVKNTGASFQYEFKELFGKNCIKLERMSYTGILPVIYSINYICFKSKISSIYETTHWINEVDLILNSYFIKKTITVELSNELDIKKKIFLMDNMAMFKIVIKYFDKSDKIQCIAVMYVSCSDTELNLDAF